MPLCGAENMNLRRQWLIGMLSGSGTSSASASAQESRTATHLPASRLTGKVPSGHRNAMAIVRRKTLLNEQRRLKRRRRAEISIPKVRENFAHTRERDSPHRRAILARQTEMGYVFQRCSGGRAHPKEHSSFICMPRFPAPAGARKGKLPGHRHKRLLRLGFGRG